MHLVTRPDGGVSLVACREREGVTNVLDSFSCSSEALLKHERIANHAAESGN